MVAQVAVGNAYVAGFTNSSNFPTRNAFQGSGSTSSYDAFLSKVSPRPAPPVFSGISTDSGSSSSDEVTTDQTLTFSGTATASSTVTLYRAGVGRVVLPTFAGEGEQGLVRVSEPIGELTHEEWLVSHHDARHDPPVRLALDAVHRLLTARAR